MRQPWIGAIGVAFLAALGSNVAFVRWLEDLAAMLRSAKPATHRLAVASATRFAAVGVPAVAV